MPLSEKREERRKKKEERRKKREERRDLYLTFYVVVCLTHN
jgi:hypothetical protein